jgi:predicted aspartyl protease
VRKGLCWWFLLVTMFALTKPSVAKSDTKDRTLKFDLYRDYLIVARGSVGPLKGLNFLVDTGTSPAVLDGKVAQRLHLQKIPGSLAVLNGSVPAARSTVTSLHLGPIEIDQLPVVIEDLSFFQKAIALPIDGVVGLDVLGQTPFEIDYQSREIRFGTFPQLANTLTFDSRRGLPIIEAELDHVPLRLLVDTGASSLFLFRLSTPMPVSPKKVSENKNIGEAESKQVLLHGLKLGQTDFGSAVGYMVSGRSDGLFDFEGLMSPAKLGITRIAIDGKHGRMGFSRKS